MLHKTYAEGLLWAKIQNPKSKIQNAKLLDAPQLFLDMLNSVSTVS